MIEVKNVSKTFTKKINKKETQTFYADENISFTLKEGEILGILGPNGAGKTTLLRMLSNLMNPTSGTITIDDQTYDKNDLNIKRSIAYLSGNTKLYKDISPYELLHMCAEYYNVSGAEIESRITAVSKDLSLQPFLHQRIENLSTGQMQRVNIARCIIHNPKYYILDEATSGLDIISSKAILDFIKAEKKKDKGIIYSTHYMEEAENICDRVILVHHGHIIEEGTPSSIIKKTKTTNLRDAFFALIGDDINE